LENFAKVSRLKKKTVKNWLLVYVEGTLTTSFLLTSQMNHSHHLPRKTLLKLYARFWPVIDFFHIHWVTCFFEKTIWWQLGYQYQYQKIQCVFGYQHFGVVAIDYV
jgi:hypothetical protein